MFHIYILDIHIVKICAYRQRSSLFCISALPFLMEEEKRCPHDLFLLRHWLMFLQDVPKHFFWKATMKAVL